MFEYIQLGLAYLNKDKKLSTKEYIITKNHKKKYFEFFDHKRMLINFKLTGQKITKENHDKTDKYARKLSDMFFRNNNMSLTCTDLLMKAQDSIFQEYKEKILQNDALEENIDEILKILDPEGSIHAPKKKI